MSPRCKVVASSLLLTWSLCCVGCKTYLETLHTRPGEKVGVVVLMKYDYGSEEAKAVMRKTDLYSRIPLQKYVRDNMQRELTNRFKNEYSFVAIADAKVVRDASGTAVDLPETAKQNQVDVALAVFLTPNYEIAGPGGGVFNEIMESGEDLILGRKRIKHYVDCKIWGIRVDDEQAVLDTDLTGVRNRVHFFYDIGTEPGLAELAETDKYLAGYSVLLARTLAAEF